MFSNYPSLQYEYSPEEKNLLKKYYNKLIEPIEKKHNCELFREEMEKQYNMGNRSVSIHYARHLVLFPIIQWCRQKTWKKKDKEALLFMHEALAAPRYYQLIIFEYWLWKN